MRHEPATRTSLASIRIQGLTLRTYITSSTRPSWRSVSFLQAGSRDDQTASLVSQVSTILSLTRDVSRNVFMTDMISLMHDFDLQFSSLLTICNDHGDIIEIRDGGIYYFHFRELTNLIFSPCGHLRDLLPTLISETSFTIVYTYS